MGKRNRSRDPLSYDLISKYRSVIMGFAILCIIFFHFTQDCQTDDLRYRGFIKLYYWYVGSSSVDTFLLLSGFGLYYSMKKQSAPDLRRFYIKRYTQVLIPYLLVAIPALLWRDTYVEGRSFLYYLSDLVYVTFFRQGRTWFWYVFMICLCYLIFPYVFQIIESAQDDITAQMRVILMFCFTTVIGIMLYTLAPNLYKRTNIVLLRFFPFILGCYLGRVAYVHKRMSPGVVILCCMAVPLVFLRNLGKIMLNRYTVAFFNYFLCFLLIVFLEYGPLEKVKTVVLKALEWVGGYTLELYLSHIMIRGVMRMLGYPCSALRHEAIMVAISFALAILLKRVSNVLSQWILRLSAPKSAAQP